MACVQNQHHGCLQGLGDRYGAAAAAVCAVEQSHHPFNQQERFRPIGGEVADQVAPHGVAVEINGGCATGSGEKGGVDIVGPRFGGIYPHAGAAHGAKQAERDSCLAASRGEAGNNQPA